MTNAKELDAVKVEAGKYAAKFEGLTALTEYYYVVEVTTAYGTSSSKVASAYTNPIPVEDTTATVTLIVNSDTYKTTTVNVKVGKELTIRFPLTKYGYTFEGWYLDEAYTKPYTVAPLESADDFTLYAKWKADAPVQTTQKPESTTAGTTAGTTAAPAATGCGGVVSKGAEPMLLGGGIIASLLGAVAGSRAAKGKKRNEADESEK